MTPAELTDKDIALMAQDLRDKGEPFAIATVIRTAGSTAAKPGAKALLDAQGHVLQGWIGGGCVRGALVKAVARALEQGQPQLISLHPQDVLDEKGVAAGDDVDGIRFAKNGCPSKGSVDVFVEMVVPLPELVIYGVSPVAQSLVSLSGPFNWDVTTASADMELGDAPTGRARMIVVATQGKDDLASLVAALNTQSDFVAFVGSVKKFASLSEKLMGAGFTTDDIAKVHAPAGLHINAVTPNEIALSILAQLTQKRRHMFRGEGTADV